MLVIKAERRNGRRGKGAREGEGGEGKVFVPHFPTENTTVQHTPLGVCRHPSERPDLDH
jgi:hypothetical protein